MKRSELPNTKALDKRIAFLKDKIKECEGEIPEEFWCDNCKRLKKKIENILEKVTEITLQKLKELEESMENDFHTFSPPTPTFQYRCSQCGFTFINEHLWPPLGSDGIIEEINQNPVESDESPCI